MAAVAEYRQVGSVVRFGLAPPADPELLERATTVESNAAYWGAEFEWLLRHPAIGPVAAPGEEGAALCLRRLAPQHAARFPVVSGDAAWLAERSMAVVARRVAPLLAHGGEVSMDLSTLTREAGAASAQREQMRLVAAGLGTFLPPALARYGVTPGRLALSAAADHPGLGELVRLRDCAALARPRIVLRVPDRLMLALRGAETAEAAAWPGDPLRLWQGLTSLAHRAPGIHLVFQHTTRPTCALAGNERGDAVLPLSLFEARADTAWPAVRIAVDHLGVVSPAQALQELRRLLRAGLRLADNLVEQLDWATPELAQDALVNRRLAVHLTGIGDLLDGWGLDPGVFSSVKLAVRWVGLVRRLMIRESNALARERGPFPGLDLRDIASTLTRSFGEARARRLLSRAGLRQRHLLVLSPYSVFPGRAARHPLPAYLHLLPVLRWADTVAMFGDGLSRALPVTAYRRLLRMTWAIARNRP